jgi:hypothetical protein
MDMKLQFIKPLSFNLGFVAILLPWILIIGFASTLITLCIFLTVIIGIFFFGNFLLEAMSTNFTKSDRCLLSLPTGYLTVCGLIAIAVKSGVSSTAVFWALTIIAVFVTILGFLCRNLNETPKLEGLWSLVPLSVIIALLYYLPGAIRDAVYQPDGSFNWMFVDTQYFYAIASSVKSSIGVPRLPGTSFVYLNYHFGPYSIAGALSAALGIPLGDALVRVVRPIALISLILSTCAAGRFIGRGVGREASGGTFAVVGVFFYGAFTSLLANPLFEHLTSGNLLSELPNLIPSSGGLFAHLILGHSLVHGLNALLVLLLIMLAKLQTPEVSFFNPDPSMFGPAIIFPSSILLGFAFSGLYVVMFFWFGVRYKRTLLTLAIAIGAAFYSAWVMGYLTTLSTGHMVGFAPEQTMQTKLFSALAWFFIGLGVRVYAFTKLKNPFRDPVSAAVLILFSGLVATSMFIPDYDARYGFLYAQGILGVFTFAWLSVPVYAAFEGNWPEVFSEVNKFIRVVCIASMVFLSCAVVVYAFSDKHGSHFGEYSISIMRTAKYSLKILLLSAASLFLFHRSRKFKVLITACMISVYMLGFTAWVTDWMDYGLGRLKRDVTISKGEVHGLEVLRKISGKDDIIATNQHSLPDLKTNRPNRSYAYGALSERPVLIEGWEYSSVKNTPMFNKIFGENELIFTSDDGGLVKAIIDKYNIKYIVAKPGTTMNLATNPPVWLSEIPNTGSLKIYAVTDSGKS